MDWSTILSLLSTLALVAAVVFAALQVRQTNQQRQEQVAIELIRSMQSTEWASSVGPISRLPMHGAAQLDRTQEAAATAIALRLETLGYLVYRRAVTLDLVDELLGGMTRTAWDRLAPWVQKWRQDSGNEKAYEWFQWLSERLAERGLSPTPAYRAHRDWRP
jgi:hypothetical protein